MLERIGRRVGLAALLLCAVLCGCSQPREVPFESLLSFTSTEWKKREPRLIVMSDPEDLEFLPVLVHSRPFDELVAAGKIDSSSHVLLVAYWGVRPNGGYEIEILRIQRSGRRIEVQAKFVSPKRGQTVEAMVMYPYHLVRVKKADLNGQGRLKFVLVDASSGEEVVSETHTVR